MREWGSFGADLGQFNGPQGVAVDQWGRVYVADSGNDRIQIFEYCSRKADLFVSGWTLPSSVCSGAQIVISDRTMNIGNWATPESETCFYLSTTTAVQGATKLGCRRVQSLAAGTEDTGTTAVTMPSLLHAGWYYFIVSADDANGIPEAQESDNQQTRAVYVPGPDLRISQLIVLRDSTTGDMVSISYITMNGGCADSPATKTRLYASKQPVPDSTAHLISEVDVPALPPQQSSRAKWSPRPLANGATLGLPLDIIAGTYYIIASADAKGVVLESNEKNNQVSMAVVPLIK